MLHSKYTIRLLCVTLLALALVAPTLHTSAGTDADAGRLFTTAADDDDGDDNDDDDDDNDDDRAGRRDPCRKALRRGARGDNLRRRCAAGSSSGVAKGDFNGDGFGDLAVGVPGEDIDGQQDAGAVNVIYGSSAGLVASGADVPFNQFFTQEGIGSFGDAEAFDRFGSALASGDFNDDGHSDLAIGVPGEELRGTINSAGRVSVLYGSASGLTLTGSQDFTQDSEATLEEPEAGDAFGSSLAWGDFNGDGIGDLAIGVPGEDVGSIVDAGAMHSLFGSLGVGLTAANDRFFTQDSVGAVAEANDRFGSRLAAGDFNGDSRSDLAIGVPLEDVGSIVDAGAVLVIYGTDGGLFVLLRDFFTQDSEGIIDQAEEGDRFGDALAAGDFNGNSRSDLAIGVPGEDVGSLVNAGAVNVIYGTDDGLSAAGDQFWTQNSLGVPDTAEGFDGFGQALAAGNFNFDGSIDLAIGVPSEDVGSILDAGAVTVIYGSVAGLWAFEIGSFLPQPTKSSLAQFFAQGQSGLPDSAGFKNEFGGALTAWDFGIGPFADLAIGVPRENVGGISNAGAAHVLYGGPPRCCVRSVGGFDGFFGGLSGPGQFWTQDSQDILDQAEDGDGFGRALY